MIYIVYTLILKGKNTRKVFFHSQDPAMSPRGGLTMGRIADGRCELVDLSYIRGVLSGGGVYSMGCNTVQHRCGQLRVTKCAFCY